MDLEPNVRYCQYNIDENDENLGDLLSGAKSSLTEGSLRNGTLFENKPFLKKCISEREKANSLISLLKRKLKNLRI